MAPPMLPAPMNPTFIPLRRPLPSSVIDRLHFKAYYLDGIFWHTCRIKCIEKLLKVVGRSDKLRKIGFLVILHGTKVEDPELIRSHLRTDFLRNLE
jgi:hypothetical protein